MAEPERIIGSSAGLLAELTDLWVAVTDAGGAVGFDRGDPRAAIHAAAVTVMSNVDSGRSYLYVLRDNGLLGCAEFVRGQRPVRRHNAELTWLMVHPATQGKGIGGRLLDHGLAEIAGDGVETVFLLTRSGDGLGAFYQAHGFSARGHWPDAVKLADGSYRNEEWFTRALLNS